MQLFDYPEAVSGWDASFTRYAMLKTEYGAAGVAKKMAEIQTALQEKLDELIALPDDEALARAEPDALEAIQALRPAGARRMWSSLGDDFRARLEGALLGRCAGCTLGSIVEGWDVARMERWAAYLGDSYPLVDYWSQAEQPHEHKYQTSRREDFTPAKMDGVPTDDDINYTQLGLLILEEYGLDFTTDDLGAAWVKYLPFAFTAEGIALDNLRKGVPALQAADVDNPCVQYIGADIRSDPWGYAAPGYPEKAAEFAHRDAYVSHRRNGIYGAMYFSAAIAAAFAVDDPVKALRIGLEEIPAECYLAREVRWALDEAPNIENYRQARAAVDARYPGMHKVHAINNAVLTIWGLTIGGEDYSKVIGETVAMGLDNDCTAATAGSIWGAVYGKDAIPEHWHANFNNKAHTFLIGQDIFALDDMVERFIAQAGRVLSA
ncbi:MAG: ADP-ribosylglycohydrolase family protein [Chloroflexi bacterium]|nr:ADP-ribosylglycohydrolase family protein [Chloroflexota bacterium]MCY3582557.1 ADP-ribosylglycohydrolase family protein [Chloroflexota bacterium]MCY3717905.1 ADP-ribosylglycohydrolase family protein [Chloroflexota bacterium]MDE2649115.1 ADP-ribosylglycohydrolase family protein [Chloroflexota bacterium]MXX51808.1 ADP-ribosylglycohydrolase family protein [Chloroflexota bacterium]